jgi:hypothetical protein
MNPTGPFFICRIPGSGTTVIACNACAEKAAGVYQPMDDATAADLGPEDCCSVCHTPLLEAGQLKRRLTDLGFAFVVVGTRSAWIRAKLFGHITVTTMIVLSRRDHAPLDNEDGQVAINQAAYDILSSRDVSDRWPGSPAGMDYPNLQAAIDALQQHATSDVMF